MKIKAFLILLIGLSISSCKFYQNLSNDIHDDITKGYKITRIRTTKAGYIIYARNGDLKYQIISSNHSAASKNKNCVRIKRRNTYNLDLEVVHPSPDMAPNLSIVMVYGRLKLPLRKKYHYKIYKANNLDGLCIRNEAN